METVTNETIILAILASGFLSTIITIGNGWLKTSSDLKKEREEEISKIRKEAHREFVKNVDFFT